MKSLILVAIIVVFSFCSTKAQIPVPAYHLDQPLTYNPALAGSLGEDRIYLNVVDFKQSDDFDPAVGINFDFQEPHLDEYRRGIYIAYIHQQETALQTKLSYGVELQKYTTQIHLIDPTSFSTFANFHFPIFKEKLNYLSGSIGVKYNYIYRRPKADLLQNLFGRELEILGFNYRESIALFTSAGRQFSWSGAIQYYKPGRTLISAGVSSSNLSHKILVDFEDNQFDPIFENANQSFGFTHLNFSAVIAENLAFELNFLGGFSEHIGGGLSFRTGEERLFRIHFSRTRVNLVNDYFSVALNIQEKKCNVNLTLTGRNTELGSPRPRYVLQLGVGYAIGGERYVSLLRLD